MGRTAKVALGVLTIVVWAMLGGYVCSIEAFKASSAPFLSAEGLLHGLIAGLIGIVAARICLSTWDEISRK